ncbi:odorant receptor Or2-like [Prorops nasuta]|uniref:odorant receptor Or2-like n=1 Tax=Prorops nasuta TaxID=863751 RepID=UPI0034CD9AF4
MQNFDRPIYFSIVQIAFVETPNKWHLLLKAKRVRERQREAPADHEHRGHKVNVVKESDKCKARGNTYTLALQTSTYLPIHSSPLANKYWYKEHNSLKQFILWIFSDNMDYPESRYFQTMKILLTVIGMWPYQHHVSALLCQTIAVSILISALVFQIATYITFDVTSELIFGLMPLTFATYLMLCIYVYFSVNINNFKQIFELIREDWLSLKSKGECEVKVKYSEFAKKITDYFTYLILGLTLTLYYPLSVYSPQILDFFMPLENGTRDTHQLIFNLQFFVDHKKYYYWITFHSFCVLVLWILIGLSFQSIFILHMFHGYGMFACLGYRLQVAHLDLTESPFAKDDGENYRESIEFYNVLTCAKRHVQAINFVSKLEYLYGTLSFAIVTCLFAALCPTLVKVTSSQLIDYQSTVFFIGQITFMFGNAYIGQSIIDESQGIFEKTYFSYWYNFSVRSCKILMLMTRRSSKPCRISAYNLLDVSVENLRVFVRTLLSYYTVIRQVRD